MVIECSVAGEILYHYLQPQAKKLYSWSFLFTQPVSAQTNTKLIHTTCTELTHQCSLYTRKKHSKWLSPRTSQLSLQKFYHWVGVNKTQATVVRVSKALGTLFPVFLQFGEKNLVPESAGTHCIHMSEKETDVIIHKLQESKVFSSLQFHAHRSFPAPRDVLHAKSHTVMKEW